MRRPGWHDYDYDPSLQMLRQPPQEPDMAKLRFLRWLAENHPWRILSGSLQGPSSGPFADGTPTP